MMEFILTLALFHAPIVYQQIGDTPPADHIVSVNFDGDWVANNNWDNTGLFPSKAYAYYEVFETKTHYYIFYAFFHSRDYSSKCFSLVCHENDLEGAMILVEKDGTPFGKTLLLQTLAHNRIYSYLNPKLIDIDPTKDLFGRSQRIGLYIESGGHGIYILDKNSLDQKKASDEPDGDKFLIYRIGHTAEDVRQAISGEFRYSLLSIHDQLWSRRSELGKGKLYLEDFPYGGSRWQIGRVPRSFAGERWSSGKANPPWAWHDSTRKGVQRGDWFFDPAHFVQTTLNPRSLERKSFDIESRASWDVSNQYLRNPYLPDTRMRQWSQMILETFEPPKAHKVQCLAKPTDAKSSQKLKN